MVVAHLGHGAVAAVESGATAAATVLAPIIDPLPIGRLRFSHCKSRIAEAARHCGFSIEMLGTIACVSVAGVRTLNPIYAC